MDKERVDVILAASGLAASREKAKALIMAGEVYSGEKKITKPGELLNRDTVLIVKGNSCPYVSRGGLKLEKAMRVFDINLSGRVCADIGASTGGFTDCMLKNGAKRVFSVDVGYGQLDWSLRSDSRVVVMERTNARFLTADSFAEAVSFASVDVSFISLKLIFPALAASCIPEVITLIKPQFEAGREKVGKNGVVRDPHVREDVIRDVFCYAHDNGFAARALDFSPIKGPSGNIEFIAHFTCGSDDSDIDISAAVKQSTAFFAQ